MILPEEDKTGTGTTEGLVSSSGNNIAVLKRVVQLLSSDETGSVGDIGHEPSALLVSDFTELGILPVTGVSRSTADNEARFEDLSLGGKAGVVDEV